MNFHNTPILEFPHKKLRSEVICDYVKNSSYDGIVVFTCGNAGAALKEEGGKWGIGVVIPEPSEWYSNERISKEFPNFFDATSGHLPLWLMWRVANRFHEYFNANILGGLYRGEYYVPTGSGETIFELHLAYPTYKFTALYNYNKGSKYEELAPLNSVISSLFPIAYYG